MAGNVFAIFVAVEKNALNFNLSMLFKKQMR